MQASHILAENIKTRYIESNQIKPTYAISYILTQSDQPSYILATKKQNNSSGNDVDHYINGINKIYGKNYLTINQLYTYSYLDLADPFLFYSAYSFFTNQNIEVPMILLVI